MAKGKALRDKSKVVRKAPVPTQPPQPEKPWPRPAIGIPLERAISHADKVLPPLLGIAQYGLPFIAVNYGRPDLVRNKFGLHTLGADITHVVMLDDNRIHPYDIVRTFMQAFIKNPDLRVIAGSGGNFAVDRRVFEDLDFPWFKFSRNANKYTSWPNEVENFFKLCKEFGVPTIHDNSIVSQIPDNHPLYDDFVIYDGVPYPVDAIPNFIKENTSTPRPVLGIPLESVLSYADKVIFNLLAIAQQGFPIIITPHNKDVAESRERILLAAKSMNATIAIMLDQDHVHRFDIIQQFTRRFIENKDVKVVGGLNFRRGEPYDPCAYVYGDDERYHPMSQWDRGSLLKLDAIGTGSIAISVDILDKLPRPWFDFDYSKALDDNWPGEDMFFSKLCMDNGIDLFVDPEITSPHMIDAVVDESTFREYNEKNGKGSIPIEQVVSRMKKELQNEGDRTE